MVGCCRGKLVCGEGGPSPEGADIVSQKPRFDGAFLCVHQLHPTIFANAVTANREARH